MKMEGQKESQADWQTDKQRLYTQINFDTNNENKTKFFLFILGAWLNNRAAMDHLQMLGGGSTPAWLRRVPNLVTVTVFLLLFESTIPSSSFPCRFNNLCTCTPHHNKVQFLISCTDILLLEVGLYIDKADYLSALNGWLNGYE